MSNGENANSSGVDKVLTIPEEISEHSDGISLAELVKRTGIAKTTVFRTLETLKERQYVMQDNGTERYHLDLKSLELGIKGLMNVNLVEVSIPYLKTLSAKPQKPVFWGSITVVMLCICIRVRERFLYRLMPVLVPDCLHTVQGLAKRYWLFSRWKRLIGC